jgi:hypothetical protein
VFRINDWGSLFGCSKLIALGCTAGTGSHGGLMAVRDSSLYLEYLKNLLSSRWDGFACQRVVCVCVQVVHVCMCVVRVRKLCACVRASCVRACVSGTCACAHASCVRACQERVRVRVQVACVRVRNVCVCACKLRACVSGSCVRVQVACVRACVCMLAQLCLQASSGRTLLCV